jgi:hypothetical protein
VNDTYMAQLVLLATTLVTTAIGVVGAWLRARRDRKWAIEDRRLSAESRVRDREDLLALAKTEAEALVIKAEGIAKALSIETAALAARALQAAEELKADVAQVGASAHRAYQEANHVNVKIEQLNERLLASEAGKTTK